MKTIVRKIIGFSLVSVLAACGGDDPRDVLAGDDLDVPEADRYGGTAVVGAIGDIPDISPLTSTDHTANQVQKFVLFTPLIRYNEDFEPEPWGAESWEINDDTTAIIFHLRDDLFWQDGTKTTAADWKFSYDLAQDPNTAFPNTAFWTHYGEAEAVDSFTFRVAMEPHADYMDPWRAFAPVPKHVLEGVDPAQIKNHPFSTSEPVGNGPFRFASRTPGQNWVFEANPDFPEELGGRPYLDRIVYRSVPEPTTLLTELLTGNIDYYIAPSPEQADQIEASPNARLLSFPDRAFVLIGWNQRREMFEDPRVRRALTMAIDRQEIIEGVRRGFGDIANSTVPPIFWQHDENAGADLEHDPERARELLAEAGWIDRDDDGILENEEGTEFRFTLKTNQGNQERKDITEIIQAQLRPFGIDVQPRILEWGTLLNQINDPELRDFDAVLIGWVTEFRIDDTDLFHCDKMTDPYQWVSYCNPEADRLLDTLPRIVNRDVARPFWTQYQQKIAEDQPYTFLYFTQRLEGVSERLRNVDPDARGDWLDARNWYILPNMRRAD